MTRILLIRHASTEIYRTVLCGRIPGIHLDEAGRRQAQRLARSLKTRTKIAAVFSSPLDRARETACIIAEPFGVNVSPDEGFNEIDFGHWSGKSFTELSSLAEWIDYNRNRSRMNPPGGESLLNVQARAWHSVIEVSRAFDGAVAAIVTHADIIRCLLVFLLGMPLDLLLRLDIQPGSVSEIGIANDGVQVFSVNNLVAE